MSDYIYKFNKESDLIEARTEEDIQFTISVDTLISQLLKQIRELETEVKSPSRVSDQDLLNELCRRHEYMICAFLKTRFGDIAVDARYRSGEKKNFDQCLLLCDQLRNIIESDKEKNKK
jgi:hypothetical protein